MSVREPAYRENVLPFNALRLVALREETGLRKPPQQRTREKCLYAHLRTYTHPMQPFSARAQLTAYFQPIFRIGLMARAWHPSLYIRGVILLILDLSGVLPCKTCARPQLPFRPTTYAPRTRAPSHRSTGFCAIKGCVRSSSRSGFWMPMRRTRNG